MPDKTIAEQVTQIISYGGLWVLWGVAVYLNQVRKWAEFKYSMLAINIFLAGWIGWIAWETISDSLSFKNSLVSISGFLAYPILDILEQKWVNLLIEKYLWKPKK